MHHNLSMYPNISGYLYNLLKIDTKFIYLTTSIWYFKGIIPKMHLSVIYVLQQYNKYSRKQNNKHVEATVGLQWSWLSPYLLQVAVNSIKLLIIKYSTT